MLPSSGRGGPKLPYTKLLVPTTSVFMATKRRSLPSAAGCLRFQIRYHWLLGGTAPVEGVTWSVNVSWFTPGPAYGSAIERLRMFTLGSGGVFCCESLSVPSPFTSLTAVTPGRRQGVGATVVSGRNSAQ